MHPISRKLCLHTQGDGEELTTRLIAPHIAKIKPFVLLEICRTGEVPEIENPMLSNSGAAIITLMLSGEATYKDSTHKAISLKKNDLMWTLSGSEIQHSLTPKTLDCVSVKLVLALSPALEKAPAQSTYLESNLIESDGPAKILLGRYKEALSLFSLPALINYLLVNLDAGQSWTYEPPANHSVAWIGVISGKVYTSDTQATSGELVVYEKAAAPIVFFAEEDSIFILGSSVEYTDESHIESTFSRNESAAPKHQTALYDTNEVS